MRWSRWGLGARRTPHDVVRGILSIPEFHSVLRFECSRSERSGLPFTVFLFRVERPRAALDVTRDVVIVLRERLRATDAIGWFDRRHVAALLPYTVGAGAEKVALEVRGALARAGLDVPFESQTYPRSDDATPRNGHRVPAADPTVSVGSPAVPETADVGATVGETADTPEPVGESSADALLLPSVVVTPLPWWKRAMDVGGSSLALLLLWPLIVVAAVAIKLDSRGPVLFRQRRVGVGGELFDFYKLRTMKTGADAQKAALRAHNEQTGPVFKMRQDPRMTRVGRLLRRSSIDELPQLWNVLIGDMSLVGPRPPTPDEVLEYEPWQRRRLAVTPGLTCFWQVSGRSEISFRDWVRLDLRYADARSPSTDLQVLARTVPAVISARGAF
jgi:lipopolysaccharide/colanic/teichoic acid biosynthesis glycosyltransferase